MTCPDCRYAIARTDEIGGAFVRVDIADVLVLGCKLHVGELIRILRLGREAEQKIRPP